MQGLRPLILISNDDGIAARGIHALAEVASEFADVVVVAPDGSYSAKSHSITILDNLEVRSDGFPENYYAVKGTPVDCVKLACHALVGRRPALVLSGINHGPNTSVSVHYSGTVGAAREGALLGITSCALSLDDSNHDADFSQAQIVARKVISFLLSEVESGSSTKLYNVNIPAGKVDGFRVAPMGLGHWVEKPTHFTTPFAQSLYWLEGTFVLSDDSQSSNNDETLLRQQVATITPLLIDVTDYAQLKRLEQIEW